MRHLRTGWLITPVIMLVMFGGLLFGAQSATADALVEVSRIDGTMLSVAVDGPRLYIGSTGGIWYIYDVADPSQPAFRAYGGLLVKDDVVDVQAVGNDVYLAASTDGIYRMNVTNQQKPVVRSRYQTMAKALSVQVIGNRAYVAADSQGFLVLNIVDGQALMPVVGQYQPTRPVVDAQVIDDRAYLLTDTEIQIINISNLTQPTLVGSRQLSGGVGRQLQVVDNLAFVATDGPVSIYDLNNPQQTEPVGLLNTPTRAMGITVVGDRAYVAHASPSDSSGGVVVFDVMQPSSENVRASASTERGAYRVAIQGDYAYLASFMGLRILRSTADTSTATPTATPPSSTATTTPTAITTANPVGSQLFLPLVQR